MTDPVEAPAGMEGIEPDPVLVTYVASLEAVLRDVRGMVGKLNEAQLNWRPMDARWSIAECIAHLTASGNAYEGPIARAIDRGFAKRMYGGRDFYPGTIGRWMIAQMEPPPRRRMQAPKRIVPQHVESAPQLLANFEKMQATLIEQVKMTAGLDLSRIKLGSPIVPIVRLPLGTWFAFLIAHERRHVWQARQVLQELRFPASGAGAR
jgi:hypothetical protein